MLLRGVRNVDNAQRRPESKPRQHRSANTVEVARSSAQRRPESKPRQHRWLSSARQPPSALNEGRSRNPGNTCRLAQRLRRDHCSLNEGRSRNPGNTPFFSQPFSDPGGAQRRPESKPRQHFTVRIEEDTDTDAQRRPESKPRQHSLPTFEVTRNGPLNEGRSRNPGNTIR